MAGVEAFAFNQCRDQALHLGKIVFQPRPCRRFIEQFDRYFRACDGCAQFVADTKQYLTLGIEHLLNVTGH
ncbi:MAG: hypothetical protein ACI9DC_004307 [Gammaproteobacteria bacterium]|jgi:hypothetical protein